MKYLFLSAIVCGLALFSCNDTPVEEEKPAPEERAPMSSEAFMNAYVDSINRASDSLRVVYMDLLDRVAMNKDSAKMKAAAYANTVSALKTDLNAYTTAIGDLVEKKWITEEDYQSMFHGIRLDASETSEETLKILGISFETDSITAQ